VEWTGTTVCDDTVVPASARRSRLRAVSKIGTCAICLTQDVELQDSHLLSKWTYKRVSSGMARVSPVVIRGGFADQTSKQISADLLCRGCEGRRGKHEDYVARLCWQPTGTFPIMAKLRRDRAQVGDEYELAFPLDLDPASLAYFAISTVWMADVMHAHGLVRALGGASIDLGPGYREQLRQFLNGEQPFPAAARVMLGVFQLQTFPFEVEKVVTLPATDQRGEFATHAFMVCGLEFRLMTGACPRSSEHACLVHADPKVVPLMAFESSPLAQNFARLAAAAVGRGKLGRQTK
jgi:hypothetical protein